MKVKFVFVWFDLWGSDFSGTAKNAPHDGP